MSTEEIIPLTKQKIPTIVGYDVGSNRYTIGDEARLTGLRGKGQTAVFNFKPVFGAGDKEFSQDKDYWFHYPLEGNADPRRRARIETFSARGAAIRFLQALFANIQLPEKVIVGEPAIRNETWRENFRRHMREVFAELGIAQLDFFPEPFAVFQYYRHIAKAFPVAKQAEIVLIIDIGGGTFNRCIIRTTEQGLLARGGATSLPLGLQAGICGGSQIDKELLGIAINKAQKRGLVWKDNPIARIEKQKSPALLRIEDAKIKLSEAISHLAMPRLAGDFSHITTSVFLPKGECHLESDIEETLTGEDLKGVIREMWRRHYGKIILDTVNEARDRLTAVKTSLDRIDKVLVAGGSSRLPFMKEEIYTVLPTLVSRNNIFIGSDIDEAVAYGIACECQEQVKRDPKLSVGKIAPCVMNDLYLSFRETRRHAVQTPRIRHKDIIFKNGQLLSAPFETEGAILEYEVELPFDVTDRLFYVFTDKPINNSEEITPINLSHDVFSVPKLNKPSRKCQLQLEIKPSGLIKPVFWFRGKGNSASKSGQKVECPEFYCADFQVKEGAAYTGFDFGTSNSYIVRFASISQEITASQYPEFTISHKVKDRLRELELRIADHREKGCFTRERLIEHATNQALEIIFHSNKIEGNPLSRGETANVLSQPDHEGLSEKELEAKNLEGAYYWMIEHVESCSAQPENFIREINKMIVKHIKPNGGQYRTEPVSLSGMDFVPPQASSVPAFMQLLGEEIRNGGFDRSPLEFAVSLHTKLVAIHPFIDGNGRTARLLLNAWLLAQGLPVVILNYADRERYLHCLYESNQGDLSSLVELFIECFEQQLEDNTVVNEEMATPLGASEEISLFIPGSLPKPENDVIDEAIHEISSAIADDPIAIVMKEKILEQENLIRLEYEAWTQSFLTILAELKVIVESFNSNEIYAREGYWMRLQEYDLLSFEKYGDLSRGKGATRTWFVGFEIAGPRSREKMLLFFSRASGRLTQGPNISKVSLVVSRFDGARYQRFGTEPISLREISYQDGVLLSLSRDRIMPVKSVQEMLKFLLAEIIKTYL